MSTLAHLNRQGEKFGFYRETHPQHFAGGAGSGYFDESDLGHSRRPTLKPCQKINAARPELQWRTLAEREAAAAAGLAPGFIVPQFCALKDLWDAHVRADGADCTHYCHHPFVTARTIEPFVETITAVLRLQGSSK